MGFTVACIDGGCAKPFGEGANCTGLFGYNSQCDIQQKLLCSGGTCSKWPFKMENETCTKSENVPIGGCRGDYRCIGQDASGTCVPVRDVGAPCSDEYDCKWGLECDVGVCTLRPADYCK